LTDDAQTATMLAPWFRGSGGAPNVSASILRLLIQANAADTTTRQSLMDCLRLGIDRLLRGLPSGDAAVVPCLQGALALALETTGPSLEGVRALAVQVLSLPYLLARLGQDPRTQPLVASLLAPRFEAIVDSLVGVNAAEIPPAGSEQLQDRPLYPGGAWLLGNLLGLSVASGKTSGGYVRILGGLVSTLPKGSLMTTEQAPKKINPALVAAVPDSDSSSDEDEDKPASPEHSRAKLPGALQDEIIGLAGEAHLRSTLIASLHALEARTGGMGAPEVIDLTGEGSQVGTPLEAEAEALSCCQVYATLAYELPSKQEVRLLHTVASPTYRVLLPLWRWLAGSREMTALVNGSLGGALAVPVLDLFCRAFNRRLLLLDDDEFYDKQALFPLAMIRTMVATLKRFLIQIYWMAPMQANAGEIQRILGPAAQSAGKLIRDLHQKNCRREFAPAAEWEVREIPSNAFQDASGAHDPRLIPMLRDLPHFIPFEFRATLFTAGVNSDMAQQPRREDWAQYSRVTIRRKWEVEDGFEQLNHLGAEGALRGHIRIKYIDEHGIEEAGIDGGGLFKEFLTNCVRAGFNPDFGLFKKTDFNELYPNPVSEMSGPGELHLHYIAFLGRMVGKAIYEGILIELPFANFFLNKLLGRPNQVGDLYSLDPDLARHLMSIKEHAASGALEEMGLYFCLVEEYGYGQKREVELTPGGKDRTVTRLNHIEYIYCVADYYLNRQISRQCRAFLKGFQDVIKPEWLRMFSSSELQKLVSGTEEVLDVNDFKAHTTYSGEFNADHPTIACFWEVVSDMSNEDRSKLLRFVTSCSRPPLLGFKQVQPPFCIHYGGPGGTDKDAKLPSASTCMNLLKLPAYGTVELLREKLKVALDNGEGFGLS